MVENKNGEVPHYYLTMEVRNSAQFRRNSAQFGAILRTLHTPRRDRWAWTS